MTKFTRKLGNKFVTIIVSNITKSNRYRIESDTLNDKPTKKFVGDNLDAVLSKLGFDYTYDENTYNEMLDRRKLFAKRQFDKENFTKEDAEKLAELTTKLSDYAENYADGLFYEFVNELQNIGGLDVYRRNNLSKEEKEERRLQAAKLLLKLKENRNSSVS